MEKEQTLWDWCSDGRGSSVLCGEERAGEQVTDRPWDRPSLGKPATSHKGHSGSEGAERVQTAALARGPMTQGPWGTLRAAEPADPEPLNAGPP